MNDGWYAGLCSFGESLSVLAYATAVLSACPTYSYIHEAVEKFIETLRVYAVYKQDA